jgi:hydroxypyruvate isomerase
MLRFALNLSLTLKELPLLEAVDRAAALGFDTVEFWWPGEVDRKELVRRLRTAGLKVALFNFDAGNMAAGDRGLLNDPARQQQLRSNVPEALALAVELGCSRLNVLAGHWRPGVAREEQWQFAADNLRWIAAQAKQFGVTVLVEAINNLENGDYFVPTCQSALDLLDRAGGDNLAFQFDLYHLQRTEGDLTTRLRRHAARIGHIQVADAPARHEPGTGELNYAYLFRVIDELGYAGHIGLEYKPSRPVAESLAWLPANRRGDLAWSQLRLPGIPSA